MQETITDHSHIKGWGVDADPNNDPTYPMKHRNNAEQSGYSWERPAQQPVELEVLRSIERPNVSAVHGTSVPPSGLSGMIRRAAFKSSESSYARWLPLLIADRVNVVEGIIDDLAHGHVPNIFSEKGYKAMWEHDRKGLLLSVATTAVVTAVIIGAIFGRSAGKGRSVRRRIDMR
jgi:hypothetical protein